MKWNSSTITSGIKNFPYVLQSSGTYITSSQLTIPVADWNEKPFYCNVEHPATKTTFDKKIPVCSALTSTPNVKVMQASCGDNSGSSSIDLVCLITGYAPQGIKVQWLMNGEMTSISPINSLPYKAEEGTYTSTSKVSVPEADWNSEDVYTCQVIHEQSKTKVKDSIKKCSDSAGFSSPKVVMLPPSPKDLLITRMPTVKCIISKIQNTDGVNFKWSRSDGKSSGEIPPPVVTEDDDGTFTLISKLAITSQDWVKSTRFTCTVKHPELTYPVEKQITKRSGPGKDPTIYIFPPPKEEAYSEFMTLTCLIKGFSPKDIYVLWKKNGIPQGEDYYMNTEPLEEEDESYFMYSKMSISRNDWRQGMEFSCAGVHNIITEKSIKKAK